MIFAGATFATVEFAAKLGTVEVKGPVVPGDTNVPALGEPLLVIDFRKRPLHTESHLQIWHTDTQ